MHDQRKSAVLSGSQRLNELGGQSGNWLQNHMVLIFENKPSTTSNSKTPHDCLIRITLHNVFHRLIALQSIPRKKIEIPSKLKFFASTPGLRSYFFNIPSYYYECRTSKNHKRILTPCSENNLY